VRASGLHDSDHAAHDRHQVRAEILEHCSPPSAHTIGPQAAQAADEV
jgi:hypothetical protein